MTEEKTAILVDSCSDVPEELRRKYGRTASTATAST